MRSSGYAIEKLQFLSESGIYAPTWVFVPERKAPGRVILYANEAGKQVDGMESGVLEPLACNGRTVIAVDVRGIGETAPPHCQDLVGGMFDQLFSVETAAASQLPLVDSRGVVQFYMAGFYYVALVPYGIGPTARRRGDLPLSVTLARQRTNQALQVGHTTHGHYQGDDGKAEACRGESDSPESPPPASRIHHTTLHIPTSGAPLEGGSQKHLRGFQH